MRIRLMLLVVPALLVGSCGDDAPSVLDGDPIDEPNTASSAVPNDPAGSWRLVDGTAEPIAGFDVTVTIGDGQIGGTAACNGYGGTTEYGDGTISISELSSTDMGCEPDVMDLEQAFLRSLPTVDSYKVADDRLELAGPDVQWVFERLAAVPTADLVGTTWVLDGYIQGDAISNIAGMDGATLLLRRDGTLTGSTNCRDLSGTWIEAGAKIGFTEFAAAGECEDDSAWELDGRIIEVLGDGFTAEVDRRRLTLSARGETGLTHTAG